MDSAQRTVDGFGFGTIVELSCIA